MEASALLCRGTVGPLVGGVTGRISGRDGRAACTSGRLHKVLLPPSFRGQPRPVYRTRRCVAVRATTAGGASEPRSAAELVQEDTAAALPRQLEQSQARETKETEQPEPQAHESKNGRETSEEETSEEDLSGLKGALLSRVAGLDRGVAAEASDRQAVERAATALEDGGPGLDLPSQLDKLDGMWRLVYTSSFSSGSFGGSRPGPPFAGSNLKLGQVFQRISVARRELDNIVDLQISSPVPLLPPGEVTATLAHSFEVAGPSDISITFEDTRVKARGLLQQLPELTLPSLPDFLRSGTRGARSSTFATTFVDDQLRISRGDRGELRIFVKE